MFPLDPYQPKLERPSFPLKETVELKQALSSAKSEYEQKVEKIFEQYTDADKLKSDRDILTAIEQYAAKHCPISSTAKNIKVLEDLSKEPLDGGLYIIGGILESQGNLLGRVYQPGLYFVVDTSWYYGSSGRVEENQVTTAETLARILDNTGAREIFYAIIKGILAE